MKLSQEEKQALLRRMHDDLSADKRKQTAKAVAYYIMIAVAVALICLGAYEESHDFALAYGFAAVVVSLLAGFFEGREGR